MIVVALCLCGHYPLPSLFGIRYFFSSTRVCSFILSFCLPKCIYIYIYHIKARSICFITFSNPFRFFNYLDSCCCFCFLLYAYEEAKKKKKRRRREKIENDVSFLFFFYELSVFLIAF